MKRVHITNNGTNQHCMHTLTSVILLGKLQYVNLILMKNQTNPNLGTFYKVTGVDTSK